ncbi:anti-sigma factor [Stackebrandtia nassauensis]|uniref:Regulator of SigK n=1 Tax=Stackebrandtia nassauensis (strain DSM 44728 / CIP 108903 / NRRL B-16338 / NBRC 102104 / LLR-40K-21) TaxID=446470 RepID=D3Q001_STANL|nr:anti-sigma factor [Stackebrandtia nassauensis]ADD45530.1 hypothetical protein Snas_5902 [Stackebrandtia nassauensis DSM 44728]
MTEQAHTLVGAYVLDAVDDTERERVERHLAECVECEREVRELRATTARLAETTATAPPLRLRGEVLSRIRRTRQDPPPERSPQSTLRPRRIPRWRSVAAAVAMTVVVAVVGVGVTVTIMRQQVDAERAQTEQVESVLTAPDAEVSTKESESGGRVTVVSSTSRNEAVVMVSGLRPIDDDHSYQVWLVNDAGQTSAGVMEAGRRSATMLVSGIAGTDLVGVTEEPAGGSPKPTLPLVADVPLT